MTDYFCLKTGFISNYRNKVKNSLIFNVRTLYFYLQHLFAGTRFSIVSTSSFSIHVRVFSPRHYLLSLPFW